MKIHPKSPSNPAIEAFVLNPPKSWSLVHKKNGLSSKGSTDSDTSPSSSWRQASCPGKYLRLSSFSVPFCHHLKLKLEDKCLKIWIYLFAKRFSSNILNKCLLCKFLNDCSHWVHYQDTFNGGLSAFVFTCNISSYGLTVTLSSSGCLVNPKRPIYLLSRNSSSPFTVSRLTKALHFWLYTATRLDFS